MRNMLALERAQRLSPSSYRALNENKRKEIAARILKNIINAYYDGDETELPKELEDSFIELVRSTLDPQSFDKTKYVEKMNYFLGLLPRNTTDIPAVIFKQRMQIRDDLKTLGGVSSSVINTPIQTGERDFVDEQRSRQRIIENQYFYNMLLGFPEAISEMQMRNIWRFANFCSKTNPVHEMISRKDRSHDSDFLTQFWFLFTQIDQDQKQGKELIDAVLDAIGFLSKHPDPLRVQSTSIASDGRLLKDPDHMRLLASQFLPAGVARHRVSPTYGPQLFRFMVQQIKEGKLSEEDAIQLAISDKDCRASAIDENGTPKPHCSRIFTQGSYLPQNPLTNAARTLAKGGMQVLSTLSGGS